MYCFNGLLFHEKSQIWVSSATKIALNMGLFYKIFTTILKNGPIYCAKSPQIEYITECKNVHHDEMFIRDRSSSRP